MTILTTIIDCNGKPLAITTVQKEGESDQDFFARHQAAVDDARARCEES